MQPRAAPAPRPAVPWAAPLAVALAGALPLALAAWGLLLLGPAWRGTQPWLLPLAVLGPALVLAALAQAARTGGWALAMWAGALVLLSDASLPGARGEGLDAQSAAKLALWLCGLLLAVWRWDELRSACRQAPVLPMAAFVGWCLLGAPLSATPAYTAAAALALAGIAALALLCARLCTLRSLLLSMTAALSLALGLSLLMLVLAPTLALSPMDGGRLFRLGGVFGSPNVLGRTAALTVLLAALAWAQVPGAAGRLLLAAAGVLGAVCLEMSDSRGSTAALLAALALWGLRGRPLWALALLFGLLAAALALALWPAALQALVTQVSRSGHASEVFSFTGRTAIWAAAADLIGQSPWLGHGFASTRELLPASFRGAYGWTTTSAHNLWLQVWVTTGLVGLLLVLAAQASWLRLALLRPHPVRDPLVVFVLGVGVLEASAFGPSVNVLSFVWCLALALGAKAAR